MFIQAFYDTIINILIDTYSINNISMPHCTNLVFTNKEKGLAIKNFDRALIHEIFRNLVYFP